MNFANLSTYLDRFFSTSLSWFSQQLIVTPLSVYFDIYIMLYTF